jgi:hypothetical protein
VIGSIRFLIEFDDSSLTTGSLRAAAFGNAYTGHSQAGLVNRG